MTVIVMETMYLSFVWSTVPIAIIGELRLSLLCEHCSCHSYKGTVVVTVMGSLWLLLLWQY